MASVRAFIDSSIRFTSGCSMMATGAGMPPAIFPCLRLRAQSSACCSARSDCATPCTPTDRRAAFIMMNMNARPECGGPTR